MSVFCSHVATSMTICSMVMGKLNRYSSVQGTCSISYHRVLETSCTRTYSYLRVIQYVLACNFELHYSRFDEVARYSFANEVTRSRTECKHSA